MMPVLWIRIGFDASPRVKNSPADIRISQGCLWVNLSNSHAKSPGNRSVAMPKMTGGVICGSVAAGVGASAHSTGRIRLADLRNDVTYSGQASLKFEFINLHANQQRLG